MSTYTEERTARHEPADPIYPVTYGGEPPCARCFRAGRELAWTPDPIGYGLLIYICGSCARALAAREPLDLPTGDELTQTWERLARLHHNREIDDLMVSAALAILGSEWMCPQDGWAAFEALKAALLAIQHAEDPATVLDTEVTGPDHDPETYVAFWHGERDGALRRLTGGAR